MIVLDNLTKIFRRVGKKTVVADQISAVFPTGQSVALLVQAVRRATRLAAAMEARGFGSGGRTWARTSVFTGLDIWVALYGGLLAGSALAAGVLAGTFNFILS